MLRSRKPTRLCCKDDGAKAWLKVITLAHAKPNAEATRQQTPRKDFERAEKLCSTVAQADDYEPWPSCRFWPSTRVYDGLCVPLISSVSSTMRWITPFRPSAKQANDVQAARECISVEVRLLSGEHTILRIVSSSPLEGLVRRSLNLQSCHIKPCQLRSYDAKPNTYETACANPVSPLCRSLGSSCTQYLIWSPVRSAHLTPVRLL